MLLEKKEKRNVDRCSETSSIDQRNFRQMALKLKRRKTSEKNDDDNRKDELYFKPNFNPRLQKLEKKMIQLLIFEAKIKS